MQLSKRLEACLNYTQGFVYLADIGTDHALLPIEAVRRGHVVEAIAIDNKFGPYLQARNNVKKYQLEERIQIRLGDGLEKITPDTEVVVISGMGGELIATILEEGHRQNIKRFILQPNRNADIVRKTIMELGYQIIDELVLYEGSKYYDIIVVEPGKASYNAKELKFGPINLQQQPYHFIERLKQELKRFQSILDKVESVEEKQQLIDKIAQIEVILNDRS